MKWCETRSLGEITNNLDSKRIPLNELERAPLRGLGKYPYYGANNELDRLDEYIFDEKILCIAEDGGSWGQSQKCAYIVNEKCWVNNHAHVLTARPNASLEYLKYYLNKSDLNSFITGTTRGKLTRSALDRIPVPLPPLAEQQRIAAVLDKADALREKRRQALAKLDALLQSVFLEMFGDPVTNPKGWATKKFSEIGKLERGKSKHRPRNAPELLDGPYPLIQTGEVANANGYIRTYTQTYSEIGLAQSRMWKAGTLCITIAANIAKTAILTFDACFPDSIVGFSPNNLTTTEFIQHWLSFLQKELEESAPESAQKNINLKILSELAVPLPPKELQDQFVRAVKNIESLKHQLHSATTRLEGLFQSLQQRAFNGELFTEKAAAAIQQELFAE